MIDLSESDLPDAEAEAMAEEAYRASGIKPVGQPTPFRKRGREAYRASGIKP